MLSTIPTCVGIQHPRLVSPKAKIAMVPWEGFDQPLEAAISLKFPNLDFVTLQRE